MSIFDVLWNNNSDKILQKSFDEREYNRWKRGISLEDTIHRYWSLYPYTSLYFNSELLCNRLDLATNGYLLFAWDWNQKIDFEITQKKMGYQKYYLACVLGDIRYWFDKNPQAQINIPIMHHNSMNDRMIVSNWKLSCGRWRIHQVSTFLEFLDFDPSTQTSSVKVMISKGIRHQIRVHLSSIWYPILWDSLYGPSSKKTTELWLTSTGIQKI